MTGPNKNTLQQLQLMEDLGFENIPTLSNKTMGCGDCGEVLSTDLYENLCQYGTYPRKDLVCRNCRAIRRRTLKKLHKENKHNIPKVCMCCEQPPRGQYVHDPTDPRSERTPKLHLDHDHKNHTFRGWICDICNKALGTAEKSADRMDIDLSTFLEKYAIPYIKTYTEE